MLTDNLNFFWIFPLFRRIRLKIGAERQEYELQITYNITYKRVFGLFWICY
ncbi:hypothetical protein J40TS1_25820 [Paenibacillus montaniterrae]|uniref:Uncharacterized protein n=1 Tax=Paenibacillus montaniterrae TaxID=429341 RepID=A0A920CY26_9BACL|nr:hypothetical protein J40TS1_25820 [Paenibacillus montaniterrae]